MTTLKQIAGCRGYYVDVATGDIILVAAPGDIRHWRHGVWQPFQASFSTDDQEYIIITLDVTMPFEHVQAILNDKHGPLSSRPASQQPGLNLGDNHESIVPAAKVADPICHKQIHPADAAGTSEHNGHKYYFCRLVCKQHFDLNPQQFVGRTDQRQSLEC